MGHGAASNILRHGYPLTIMGHRNRAPVDDLVARGAREAATPADVARRPTSCSCACPPSVEVESTIYGDDGVLAGRPRPDSSSWIRPPPTRAARSASAPTLRKRGHPNGRRAGRQDAEGGRGGQAQHVPRRRSGRRSAKCGRSSSATPTRSSKQARSAPGHTLKLVNNFISIGTSAVIAEAVATAAKLGVDLVSSTKSSPRAARTAGCSR